MVGYRSTATKRTHVPSFREALFLGQAPDGGLLVPEAVPQLAIPLLRESTWLRRATGVMQAWLAGELAPELVARLCHGALDLPVPVRRVDPNTWIAELFHGPTGAFKDFGARFLAHAMTALRDADRRVTVLVATSGDTGSAVANAFSGLDARVVLLYPAGRVSALQELQLTAVPENAFSIRVEGTFDDCQALVRAAFSDVRLVADLGLTSANSINIGRLLPQTAYAVHAALESGAEPRAFAPGMPGKNRSTAKEAPLPMIVVPSGNLGNMTAALFAKHQGAPIGHVLAAVNRNDFLVRFLKTGKRRTAEVAATPSNAMDVGNPSNLDRILALYDGDLDAIRRDVSAIAIDDETTLATMRDVYTRRGEFVCPHTAVGLAALAQWRAGHRDDGPAVVYATAHPGKFADVVYRATGEEPPLPAAFADLERARRTPLTLRADAAAFLALLRRLGS